MTCDRKLLKREAKAAMHEMNPRPVVVGIVYYVIGVVLYLITNGVGACFGNSFWKMARLISQGVPSYIVYANAFRGVGGAVIIFVCIIVVLIGALLAFGFGTVYALRVARHDTGAGFHDLLTGFHQPGRIILADILMFIFIYLWSLLLIFPGIIAAYRLRMTLYLLSDHPELPVTEALRQSRMLMKGFKGQAFWLDLSFIGWFLLCGITGGILMIYVAPYYQTTAANFYFHVRNNQQNRGM